MYNFEISTVTADGIAPLYAAASAVAVVTTFGPYIIKV